MPKNFASFQNNENWNYLPIRSTKYLFRKITWSLCKKGVKCRSKFSFVSSDNNNPASSQRNGQLLWSNPTPQQSEKHSISLKSRQMTL